MKPHHIIIGGIIIVVVITYLFLMRKMPLPVKKARLTSKYGNRKHPVTGKQSFHNGIDLAAPTGTPIVAPAFGIIDNINYTAAGGNQLFIKHLFTGFRSGYAHLSKTHVEKGEFVFPGKHVADVGNTGVSTGPHLHLSLRKKGELVDPQHYFNS